MGHKQTDAPAVRLTFKGLCKKERFFAIQIKIGQKCLYSDKYVLFYESTKPYKVCVNGTGLALFGEIRLELVSSP
jgi:hypothetical protein